MLCIFCQCGEISPPDPALWPLPVPAESLLRLPSAGGLCEDEEEDDIFVDDLRDDLGDDLCDGNGGF